MINSLFFWLLLQTPTGQLVHQMEKDKKKHKLGVTFIFFAITQMEVGLYSS